MIWALLIQSMLHSNIGDGAQASRR